MDRSPWRNRYDKIQAARALLWFTTIYGKQNMNAHTCENIKGYTAKLNCDGVCRQEQHEGQRGSFPSDSPTAPHCCRCAMKNVCPRYKRLHILLQPSVHVPLTRHESKKCKNHTHRGWENVTVGNIGRFWFEPPEHQEPMTGKGKDLHRDMGGRPTFSAAAPGWEPGEHQPVTNL